MPHKDLSVDRARIDVHFFLDHPRDYLPSENMRRHLRATFMPTFDAFALSLRNYHVHHSEYLKYQQLRWAQARSGYSPDAIRDLGEKKAHHREAVMKSYEVLSNLLPAVDDAEHDLEEDRELNPRVIPQSVVDAVKRLLADAKPIVETKRLAA